MASLDLLLEAEKRGILPEDKVVLLAEARKRGLVESVSQPTAEPSLWDKVKGAGEAGLSALTAVPATLAGSVAGIARTVSGGQFGTPEGIRQGEQRMQEVAKNLTYVPRSETGQEYLRNVGGAIDRSKLAGMGPTEAMALAGTAGPAINQVKQGVIGETNLLGQAAGRAAQAVLPMPKPEVTALARKALALDIPLRPDMLTDNKFARMLGEAFEKIPLSGSRADARQVAFNRAVTAEIGGDRNALRLTPDVFKNAMEQSGEKIGEIAGKTPIRLDPKSMSLIDDQAAQAQKYLPSDIAKVVTNYVEEIKNKANPSVVSQSGELGLTIPGETFRKINSQIGRQVRTSTNGDLRSALIDLQDDLHELLKQNISSPDDLAALQLARKQYAIGSTIIPLVAKAPVGNISPAALMGALTSTGVKRGYMARGGGDMGDIARIGQLFLKEPASSGTAERGLVYGGVLGGGAFVEPHVAGSVYGAANLYNRVGPSTVRGLLKLDSLRGPE